MKAVMLSIRPEWCEKIAQGKKTVEIRKSKPKLETPFKCYIYCTERGRPLVYGDVQCWGGYREEYTQTYGYSKEEARKIWDVYNGHVMGEFVCDYILDIRPPYKGKTEGTCLEAKELYTYAGAKPLLYGWHISNLEIYETPENLSTFGMSRPPQSWYYVEELT